jgi:hypothetical protein
MKDSAVKELGSEIADSYNFRADEEHYKKPLTSCIALFKTPGDCVNVDGEGNFCGWYSKEYLINSEVLAVYVIERPRDMNLYFKGFKHIKEKIIKKKYERLEIVSYYNIKSFILEDENDDIAIDMFFKESYEELRVIDATNKAFEMRKKNG